MIEITTEITTTGQWIVIALLGLLCSGLIYVMVQRAAETVELDYYKGLLPPPAPGGEPLLLTEEELRQFFERYFGTLVHCSFYTDETGQQITARFTGIKSTFDVKDF